MTLGNYYFEIEYSYPTYSWIDSIPVGFTDWHDTNYTYNGSINKSKKSYNKIIVDWGNDTLAITNNVVFTQKSEFTIDSEGILSYPEYYPGFGNTCLFKPSYIKDDTIKFLIGSGGLGYYVKWQVNGIMMRD
jgi:hypothetical protein